MDILFIIGLGLFIINIIREACEPTLPSGSFSNEKLLSEDRTKVATGEMSQSQFRKNIQKGKYR